MTLSTEVQLALALLAFAVSGCGPMDLTVQKKASYADLVVTYNAEVQTLDNLEAKRKAMLAEHASLAQKQAIKAAVDSINSGSPGNVSTNPNEALDQAVAAAEMQAELQKGLLNSLDPSSQSTSAPAIAEDELPTELKTKLAEIDAEITEQKQRVERARAARDAAETK